MSVVGIDTSDVPECTECGACCFTADLEYLPLFDGDRARLGTALAVHTVTTPRGTFMRLADGRCAALVLEAVTGRALCSIYAQRPDVCRALERGSGQCRGDRRDKVELVQLARARSA